MSQHNSSIRRRDNGGRPRRVALRVEALEDRCVPAAPFVVITLADILVPFPGVPSLRQAILDANSQAGDDVITFAPGLTGTIQLARTLPDLSSNIDIQGPGANVLTVRRDSGGDYRIFTIRNAVTVSLSGLTLANGNTADNGGGIANLGTLTLSNSTLSGNSASGGGGIFNLGTLALTNSTFSGNKADFGGGIANFATLTLSNSTLSGNSSNYGGGIYNLDTLALSNSTLSGNTANFNGGGLFNRGSVTVTNATITANRGDADFNTTGQGGGIYTASTLRLRNTIVAGNFHGAASARDDIIGAVDASAFNLVGDGTGLTGITDNDANGNQVGSAVAPIDPRLGPLQDNGGPTATHALRSGSPAIDRGLTPGVTPATDQRGVGRSGLPDIGAFEYIPPPPVVLPRAIVAALVSRKVGKTRRLFVRVSFADTGALKAEVRSPFQNPAFRAILVAVFDSDGDGLPDTVRLTARKGKKTLTRLFAV